MTAISASLPFGGPAPSAFRSTDAVTNPDSGCIAALDDVVMPALWKATRELHSSGFRPGLVSRTGGIATLEVRRDSPEADAWLCFQLPQNAAQGLAGECAFWMYGIHHPGGMTAGKPGRLENLTDGAAVDEIVAAFIQACHAAPHGAPGARAWFKGASA